MGATVEFEGIENEGEDQGSVTCKTRLLRGTCVESLRRREKENCLTETAETGRNTSTCSDAMRESCRYATEVEREISPSIERACANVLSVTRVANHCGTLSVARREMKPGMPTRPQARAHQLTRCVFMIRHEWCNLFSRPENFSKVARVAIMLGSDDSVRPQHEVRTW